MRYNSELVNYREHRAPPCWFLSRALKSCHRLDKNLCVRKMMFQFVQAWLVFKNFILVLRFILWSMHVGSLSNCVIFCNRNIRWRVDRCDKIVRRQRELNCSRVLGSLMYSRTPLISICWETSGLQNWKSYNIVLKYVLRSQTYRFIKVYYVDITFYENKVI